MDEQAGPDGAGRSVVRTARETWWPRRSPWWHTVLYLLVVVGDHVSAFGQDAREPWQQVLSWVLLPLAVVGVLRRTSWPLLLPGVAIVAAALAGSSMLPVAVLSLVLRRRDALTVVLLVAAAGALFSPWSDAVAELTVDGASIGEGYGPLLELAAGVVAQVVVPALLGGYLAVRRRLALEAEERLRLTEEAQAAREREAVLAERRRIAAEMHDAVGHQLALVNLQAGGLEVNPGAGPQVVEERAAAIRTAASAAARDLRAVLDVLAPDAPAPAAHAPQPGLADVPGLLAATRAAGAVVHEELGLTGVRGLDAAVGRAAYRIVQESLTNALRHAPGVPVEVTVDATPGRDVRIRVATALGVPPPAAAGAPGSGRGPGAAGAPGAAGQAGQGAGAPARGGPVHGGPVHGGPEREGPARGGLGLGGLAERARSVGGTLTAGPDERGDAWVVSARLPWSTDPRHEDGGAP